MRDVRLKNINFIIIKDNVIYSNEGRNIVVSAKGFYNIIIIIIIINT